MKYNQLDIGRHRPSKRVGRGIAAGQGKTAGRGTKGQGARTGSTRRPGFSGGQNPLMQQLPKLPGFRSQRQKAETIYTGQLDALTDDSFDAANLAGYGLLSTPHVRAKLLHKGELNRPITVKLSAASASAVAALQRAGGSFESVGRLARPSSKSDAA